MSALQVTPLGEVAVVEVTDHSAFLALELEWDALVEATGNTVFYRHAFIRIWVDNFAPEARLRVLIARAVDGRLVGVLPLLDSRGSLYGVPVQELASTANPHSCRFDLVTTDAATVGAAFLEHLECDPDWTLLRIIDVPEQGAAFSILEAAAARGYPHGTWTSLESPFIPLATRWEEQQARLQSKFKANLRRRRKKLEERGKVTFERVSGGTLLDAKLEEGFALERSGWKGQRGTAMAQDPKTRGFYTELARHLSYRGELALYFLRLDGRAVAFHFGIESAGRYYLLKPGYDETLKECSPGQLLMEEVLRACVNAGLSELDFLGPDMPWKRDWTERVRVHTWLFIFRNSRFGRALCRAKFEWVPKAKEAVERWKR